MEHSSSSEESDELITPSQPTNKNQWKTRVEDWDDFNFSTPISGQIQEEEINSHIDKIATANVSTTPPPNDNANSSIKKHHRLSTRESGIPRSSHNFGLSTDYIECNGGASTPAAAAKNEEEDDDDQCVLASDCLCPAAGTDGVCVCGFTFPFFFLVNSNIDILIFFSNNSATVNKHICL